MGSDSRFPAAPFGSGRPLIRFQSGGAKGPAQDKSCPTGDVTPICETPPAKPSSPPVLYDGLPRISRGSRTKGLFGGIPGRRGTAACPPRVSARAAFSAFAPGRWTRAPGRRYPDSCIACTITSSAFFAGDLIGLTTGLLITVLLLVLTLRAAKLPGTPRANIVFAACAFLWSAGGLADAALRARQCPAERWRLVARAVQYSGVAAFPIPVLAIWRAPRILRIAGWLSAGLIAAMLWSARPRRTPNCARTAYNAALLLLLGAAASLRRDSTPRAVYAPSLVIVCAVCATALTITFASYSHPYMTGIGGHLVLLVLLCAFLLFARFRFADVFIRYGVRILLAGLWATVLTVVAQSWVVLQLAHRTPSPAAAHVFLVMVMANLVLLSFTFIDERIGALAQPLAVSHAGLPRRDARAGEPPAQPAAGVRDRRRRRGGRAAPAGIERRAPDRRRRRYRRHPSGPPECWMERLSNWAGDHRSAPGCRSRRSSC